jgi:mRNA interferase RelE/StbE
VVNISSQETWQNLKFKPFSGERLLHELTGLWKYKLRRFRLIYEVDRKARLIRIFAVGHRREVYEELAGPAREARPRK